MTSDDIERCRELRKEIFLTAQRGGASHLASSYSCLEIIYTLYAKKIMKADINNVGDKNRDRFVLSKGHAVLALYAVMNSLGVLRHEELENYLQIHSYMGGEPCARDFPWIEASTGSLGHGLSVAVGMAIAQKLDVINARTFVIIGDGECEEGTIWEAALSARAFHLNNLVVILDCNGLQQMKHVSETIGVANWKEKWESFGWLVRETDGHDIDALEFVLSEKNETDRPLLIIAYTIKGKGVSVIENNPVWHYRAPKKSEKRVFERELGISNTISD